MLSLCPSSFSIAAKRLDKRDVTVVSDFKQRTFHSEANKYIINHKYTKETFIIWFGLNIIYLFMISVQVKALYLNFLVKVWFISVVNETKILYDNKLYTLNDC